MLKRRPERSRTLSTQLRRALRSTSSLSLPVAVFPVTRALKQAASADVALPNDTPAATRLAPTAA
jgi:hypothetical protein